MPDPFKAQLKARHPHPADDQAHPPALHASGDRFARDGYSVLERANRDDAFQPNLRGLAPPVTNDQPNVAWDEEK